MALTGHQNVTTVLRYFPAAPGAGNSNVKRLLD